MPFTGFLIFPSGQVSGISNISNEGRFLFAPEDGEPKTGQVPPQI